MIVLDAEKFSRELYEGFLAAHPALKQDDSELAKLVQVIADVATTAIVKYDRETSR